MKLAMVLVPFLFLATSFAADLLQNPNCKLPPSNSPGDSSAPIVLFNENNTIPGWTFEGNVDYITSGSTVALPGNGHAIKLDRDGKINQTFTKFSLKEKYGKETWESYGYQLGSWGSGESINLVFESQATETDSNSTCWPIVDMLRLKTIGQISESRDDLKGFYLIQKQVQLNLLYSNGLCWELSNTDSKHYFVPEGSAAIEIVSGVSAGIQTSIKLKEDSNYNLKFMLGDANDSCMGDFVVGVQAGSTAQNFSLQSNGTGSAKKFSLNFKGEAIATPITFLSYSKSLSKGRLYCGPVIDDVIFSTSARTNPYTRTAFLLLALLLLVTCLPMDETLRCGCVI
ncbi:hypothetical protein LguiA_016950 [Lonicera macranthoides]